MCIRVTAGTDLPAQEKAELKAICSQWSNLMPNTKWEDGTVGIKWVEGPAQVLAEFARRAGDPVQTMVATDVPWADVLQVSISNRSSDRMSMSILSSPCGRA